MSKGYVYSGKPSSGKTLRLILSGYEHCRNGKKVVIIIYDDNPSYIANKLMFVDNFYKENDRIPTFEEAKNDKQQYDLTKAELYLRNFFIHRINPYDYNKDNMMNQLNMLLDYKNFDVLMVDRFDLFTKRPDTSSISHFINLNDELRNLKMKCDEKNVDLYITHQLPYCAWKDTNEVKFTITEF
ncbi:MAG: hypothetical protein K2J20_00050 [Bacilli bacterium]|nr:hypothetical protein [Bacilli bacterium]